MSKFIKLTYHLFNTNDIHKIVIHPNKYIIHIASKQMDGFNWNVGLFGFGYISSHTCEIEVCKKTHATDYKLVTDWIDRHLKL
jgi:hypothetical protein